MHQHWIPFDEIILANTLLKHRLESFDVGSYAIAPLTRFVASLLKILIIKKYNRHKKQQNPHKLQTIIYKNNKNEIYEGEKLSLLK